MVPLGNPFRVANECLLNTQGSAPGARNPVLELVNAFGVSVHVVNSEAVK